MATITRHGKKWRAQVCVNRRRASKVFHTKQEASKWALEAEAGLGGRKPLDFTLGDAIRKYGSDVAPNKRGEMWEARRLKNWREWDLAKRKIGSITSDEIASWRDSRMKSVKPGTVARDMTLLAAIFSAAMEWKWITVSPLKGVKRPTQPQGRRRGITADEVARLTYAFDVEELKADSIRHRVGLMFLLALETAMRSGEMVKLRRTDIDIEAQVAYLEMTKNGTRREVPLSKRACEILLKLDWDNPTLFDMDDRQRDANWRKWKPKDIPNLTFHDTRGEGITRLSKKLPLLDLARAIGHHDLNSLNHYYHTTASELAKKLG